MKVYYFYFPSGDTGGVGVVAHESKEKALELANKIILSETSNIGGKEITIDDLSEVPKGNCQILDYGNN